MRINGIEIQQHELSYDKIIKNTLEQSDELTIRFINGLFGDNIPLDAPVAWLDKESVSDEYKAIVADFYPQIAGRIYSIEIEEDDHGGMALRVFKYALGGALHHNTTATDAKLQIVFPQPCVVFLKNRANTPQKLTWEIEFFDGQRVTLDIPVIKLADLTIEEMARRDLFPIGQFYLRTFELLTENKVEDFRAAAASLIDQLQDAVTRETVPYHIGLQMQDTIMKTAANTIFRSQQEVNLTMHTSILETLPVIDYQELYRKLEERGKIEGIAEGKAEGKAETQMDLAVKAFSRLQKGSDPSRIELLLKELDIPEDIIEAAKQKAMQRRQTRKRSEPER